MSDKFDKFTERARKVLTLAQEEAQRFNHNYIGTEHLLLGLVREGDGVAARVLSNMGVQLPKVRSAVEFIIGRGETMVMGEIGLTPRAKKVIELAKGGDIQAARIVFDRCYPAPKGRFIEIEMPEMKTITDLVAAHGAIMSAIADGAITWTITAQWKRISTKNGSCSTAD